MAGQFDGSSALLRACQNDSSRSSNSDSRLGSPSDTFCVCVCEGARELLAQLQLPGALLKRVRSSLFPARRQHSAQRGLNEKSDKRDDESAGASPVVSFQAGSDCSELLFRTSADHSRWMVQSAARVGPEAVTSRRRTRLKSTSRGHLLQEAQATFQAGGLFAAAGRQLGCAAN